MQTKTKRNLYQDRFAAQQPPQQADQNNVQEQQHYQQNQIQNSFQNQQQTAPQQQIQQQPNVFGNKFAQQQQQPQQQNFQQQKQGLPQPQSNQQQFSQQPVQQVQQSVQHNNSVPEIHKQPQTTPQQVQQKQVNQNPLQNKRKAGQSKIDSDQIPRPLIPLEDSYTQKIHRSNNKNGIPPQVHQYYKNIDEGNGNPRLLRATVNTLPNDPGNLTLTKIPFAMTVQPFADLSAEEEGVSIVDMGGVGPFRCSRCKGYVNPFFEFTQNGQMASCNLCKMNNQVPVEYQNQMNDFSKKKDQIQRPELYLGAYEFLASSEYKNKPTEKYYIMVCLELTPQSIITGVFNQVMSSLQALLDYVICPERTYLGISTFDQTMTFYNLPQDLNNEPSIIVVADMDDPCIVLPPESLFLNVQDCKDKLQYLFEKLLKLSEGVQKNINPQQKGNPTPVGSVINNAANCIAPNCGKVLVFSCQMPTIGLGKLKKRDDPKLLGSEKENTLYLNAEPIYDKMSRFCLENKICIDLFIFSNDFYDLASVSPLVNLTGGSLYYYPHYHGLLDGEKLHYDLARNLTRYYGSDAIMTIRTSPGIILQEYYTGMGKVSQRDLEFSAIDSDKSLAIILKQEDKIQEAEAYAQFALLYTNPYGQRVIRVINYVFQINNNIANIYRSADIDATIQVILRQHIFLLYSKPMKTIHQQLINQVVEILYQYRNHCAQSSSPGQLILPEALKLLPLYVQTTFKSDLFRLGSDVRIDDRIYEMFCYSTASLYSINHKLYPKLYPVHHLLEYVENQPGTQVGDRTILPSTLALTIDKLEQNGIYLMDTSETIYIYVAPGVDQNFIQCLFGVESFDNLPELTSFPLFQEADYSVKVNSIIDQLRKNKNAAYQNIRIITEKDYKMETLFLNLLLEDEMRGSKSYGDLLCQIHKMIQEKST